MKKRSITLIIWLMSIALMGVMAMQYYFIRESFKQKSQLFDEAVTAALASVASKIEKQEIFEFAREQDRINQEKFKADQAMRERNEQLLASQIQIQEQIKKLQRQQFDYQQRYRAEEENLKAVFPNAIYVNNAFFETYIRRKRYQSFINFNVDNKYLGEGYFDTDIKLTATREVPLVPAKDDSTRFIIPYFRNNQVEAMQTATLIPRVNGEIADQLQALENQLVVLNAKKLQQATTLFDTLAIIGGKSEDILKDVQSSMLLAKKPFRERLNVKYLKKELDAELNKRDIYVLFNIEVRDDQSYIIYETLQSNNPKSRKQLAKYSTKLFENDINSSPGLLSIYFPNKSSVIRDTMGYMMLPMIALLALLIGAFAYTLSIIFRQKKISEMKTDFMNNMTHEFKTPVATIMIASESLRDPEIAADGKRVNRLANIIYDENVRLGNHIERVLNIARLEKENLKIEKVDVHINAVVFGVLDSMNLQLQRANGVLHTDISAPKDLVIGDELHLSNVFFNLVDNAIKYSKDAPEITVKTYNAKDHIVITIADKGMGMTKDQKEKIFDQFYRIPTGNVHNVKGFGLGLSYVNDIVKRLNGRIQVKSEKDKGTVFELTFPLKGTALDREA
ncbi:HAMP domain-containing histidine kinase [Sphingobacterium sp. DN00404]|uniref:histidine kinase n=1 Tax=Sphingobacterium micropteri TaxID=2763501 RepID=A0ABR7YKR2_9SPHI|nr:HAMP domain-containing sensor histidine kinase [Sphingobacterium micropteri]MBD1431903.1 HAMP domain-containing histidine kinase [Sphingobacterium micropteri]